MRSVVDTSVIVPAVLAGSPAHEVCLDAVIRGQSAASGHAWFEAMSVLTRLAPDVRVPAPEAHRVLAGLLDNVRLLDVKEQQDLRTWLAAADTVGGAIYDAMVGWAARCEGVPLMTRDRRALPTYEAVGIEVLLIAPTLH